MALDFHSINDNQYLFKLDDNEYEALSYLFKQYRQRTGLSIEPYRDMQLPVENQKQLIALIDNYISNANLNTDKQKSVTVLGFRRMLLFFSENNTDLWVIGD